MHYMVGRHTPLCLIFEFCVWALGGHGASTERKAGDSAACGTGGTPHYTRPQAKILEGADVWLGHFEPHAEPCLGVDRLNWSTDLTFFFRPCSGSALTIMSWDHPREMPHPIQLHSTPNFARFQRMLRLELRIPVQFSTAIYVLPVSIRAKSFLTRVSVARSSRIR